MIQQLAIYASPRMPSRIEETEEMSRRGTSGSSLRSHVKAHRLDRNDGAIEFAARDDLAPVHYRFYASPRHCYRSSLRTKLPTLESLALNRHISVPMRAIAAFAPRNTKPPIREPNMPEKRERRDEGKDERRDRKERKKPVIRTDRESVDSSENRAAMVADDNPKDDPDAVFRYEWGVKLAEEPAAVEESDNDNFAEKGQRYVTRRLWGVNLKQPQPDIEGAAPPTSKGPGESAEEHRNAFANLESGDTTSDGTRRNIAAEPSAPTKEPDTSSLKGTTAEYLSTSSNQPDLTSSSSDLTAMQRETTDADWPASSEELRKIIQTSPNMLREKIMVDDDYNVPEEATVDAEITAWRNLVAKSMTSVDAEKDLSSAERAENLEMVSIRPKAPQPRLGTRIMKTTGDNYSSDKKLHTASMQIRNAHRGVGNIIEVPICSASTDRIAQMQHPKFTLAFSTELEDSKREKIIDNASSLQDKRQMDSKGLDEEKSNNAVASDSSESTEPSSLHVEHQTFSYSDQQQVDADVDPARTLNAIADKEIETSLDRSQDADRKSATHPSTSLLASSGTTGKDEDAYDDTEREDDASYVDFNATDDDLIKPTAESRLVKEATKSAERNRKNTTLDSNAEDHDDDSSKEYVTDGDYVRIPGDSYPYSREHLERWRASQSDDFVCKPIEQERSLFDSPSARPTPRNANGAGYAAGASRDSHAAGAVMETSGSGDGASAKNVGPASGFRLSSRDQRVASDCPRGDAANAPRLRRWTAAAASARHGAIASGKTNVAERGDNAPLRAYHQ